METKIDEQYKMNERRFIDIQSSLSDINEKLDSVISQKADRSELEQLSNKLWGVTSAVVILIVGVLLSLIHK